MTTANPLTSPSDLEESSGADSKVARLWAFLRRPPKFPLHITLTIAVALIVWGESVPGLVLIPYLAGALLAFIVGVFWLTRLVTTLVWQWRESGRFTLRLSVWYLAAPVLALTLALLIGTSAALRFRWEFSKSEFEEIAREVPPPPSSGSDLMDVPAKIGSYSIVYAVRIPQGVLFYDHNGSFFDDAGFAYLPSGPSPDMENETFEGPRYKSLGGDWYAWIASW